MPSGPVSTVRVMVSAAMAWQAMISPSTRDCTRKPALTVSPGWMCPKARSSLDVATGRPFTSTSRASPPTNSSRLVYSAGREEVLVISTTRS